MAERIISLENLIFVGQIGSGRDSGNVGNGGKSSAGMQAYRPNEGLRGPDRVPTITGGSRYGGNARELPRLDVKKSK